MQESAEPILEHICDEELPPPPDFSVLIHEVREVNGNTFNVLEILKKGKSLFHISDRMGLISKFNFNEDLSWIKTAIMLAYVEGVLDGKDAAKQEQEEVEKILGGESHGGQEGPKEDCSAT